MNLSQTRRAADASLKDTKQPHEGNVTGSKHTGKVPAGNLMKTKKCKQRLIAQKSTAAVFLIGLVAIGCRSQSPEPPAAPVKNTRGPQWWYLHRRTTPTFRECLQPPRQCDDHKTASRRGKRHTIGILYFPCTSFSPEVINDGRLKLEAPICILHGEMC